MKYYRGSTVPSRRARKASKKLPPMNVLLLSRLLKWALFGLIACVVLFLVYAVWVSRDLPAPGKLASASIKDSTKILDKNGTILYSIYNNYNRIYIPLDQIPKNLRNATIATEDSTFYENNGFSWKGYARAAVDLVLHHGQIEGGGSTITQQLVKNVLLTSQQTYSRKLKELILAVQVDKRYSKDDILEMYLNNIPYGGTSIGVEAAANLYFNKHAKDLDLAQCAFLAGLPQSPSYYSPFINPDKAYLARSQVVLNRMVTTGYISQKQADTAYKEIQGFSFSDDESDIKAPHFVMDVRSKLVSMFGESMVDTGDLTVKTTLDYSIQQQAEKTVKTELDNLKGYHVSNGAALVLDAKDGAVLAMVGSKDYFDKDNQGNFNAVYASRQPGSSTKPILYATAFEKGYTPATLLMDTQTSFPNSDGTMYTPVNYEGTFSGPMQVRYALGNSENVPAVKMLAMVGIKNFMQKAYDMGITNWQPTPANLSQVGLSLVLGGREASLYQVTSAYQVFANQGVKKEPFEITEVDSSNGKVLYKHEDDPGTKILTPEISFLISHILSDDSARQAAFGAHSWLYIPGKTVSVKTGTTDDKKDNWTFGYTPSYVVGVWVGNNDDTAMNQAIASGITGASPIWNKIMASILAGKKDEPEPKPDDVIAMQIDALGGGLPVAGQPIRAEYFIKGTEPTAPSPIYKQIKVSKQDNSKLANADEISHGDYDVKNFVVFQESDPVSTDGVNRWQQGIDAWVNQKYPSDPLYHPPTDTSDRKY